MTGVNRIGVCQTVSGANVGRVLVRPERYPEDALYTREIPRVGSIEVVARPDGGAGQAFKFIRLATDDIVTDGYRTEIRAKAGAKDGETWEYAFSTYTKQSEWPDEGTNAIITQLHTSKPSNSGVFLSPPVSLFLNAGTPNTLSVNVRGDNRFSMPNINPQENTIYPVSDMIFDAKIDWRFRVKYSYNGNGKVEVWQDGAKVITHVGKVGYNNGGDINIKSGIYKANTAPTLDYTTYIMNIKYSLIDKA